MAELRQNPAPFLGQAAHPLSGSGPGTCKSQLLSGSQFGRLETERGEPVSSSHTVLHRGALGDPWERRELGEEGAGRWGFRYPLLLQSEVRATLLFIGLP